MNQLKLIQLGITLANEDGEYPKPNSTWQFNFRFHLPTEKYNKSSIDLLKSSGIDFQKLATKGIDHKVFAEYFMMSGLILNKEVTWTGFHTDHDFCYLLKVFKGGDLPHSENQFLDEITVFFPNIFDVKVMADRYFNSFKSSLSNLAGSLDV